MAVHAPDDEDAENAEPQWLTLAGKTGALIALGALLLAGAGGEEPSAE